MGELGVEEAKPLASLDPKASPFDRRLGIARGVAVAERARPDCGVGGTLERPPDAVVRGDVLVEVQPPTGTEHPTKLGQRGILVGHRAQDE